jgi:hypothetical protein
VWPLDRLACGSSHTAFAHWTAGRTGIPVPPQARRRRDLAGLCLGATVGLTDWKAGPATKHSVVISKFAETLLSQILRDVPRSNT